MSITKKVWVLSPTFPEFLTQSKKIYISGLNDTELWFMKQQKIITLFVYRESFLEVVYFSSLRLFRVSARMFWIGWGWFLDEPMNSDAAIDKSSLKDAEFNCSFLMFELWSAFVINKFSRRAGFIIRSGIGWSTWWEKAIVLVGHMSNTWHVDNGRRTNLPTPPAVRFIATNTMALRHEKAAFVSFQVKIHQ
jgi:hypothetical protein